MRFTCAGVLLAVMLVVVADASAEVRIVNVFDYDFSINQPGEPVEDAVIRVGDTVRWVFLDSGHSATSVAGNPEFWNSGYVGVGGQTFDHTFTHEGTWWYYCFPHGNDRGDGTADGMAGTITVRVPAPGVTCFGACAGLMFRRRRASGAGL